MQPGDWQFAQTGRGVSCSLETVPLLSLPFLPPLSHSSESLRAARGLQCGGLKGVFWFLAGTGNFDVARALLYLGCKFIWGARRD